MKVWLEQRGAASSTARDMLFATADTPKNVAKMHTLWHSCRVKAYDWSDEKNEWLRQERGITFEDIVFHLAHGGLLDMIEHPNPRRYPGQRIFIVNVDGYVCLVPFVEDDRTIFLKTIIPSRKMTRQYLGDA